MDIAKAPIKYLEKRKSGYKQLDGASFAAIETVAPALGVETFHRSKEDFTSCEIEQDPPENDCRICCPNKLTCCGAVLQTIALSQCLPGAPWCFMVRVNREAEAVLALSCGKFVATKKTPGLYCINPCGMKTSKVSLKQKTIELRDVKLLDLKGNPVVVGGCIFWRIVGVKAALLNVESVEQYVSTSAMAVLKQIVAQYPYEDDKGQSLKTEAAALGIQLASGLQSRVSNAGVKIVAFNMTDLSYAPEIAQAMLVRQQAEAMVKARELIVKGAVEIAQDAIQQLKSKGIVMSEGEKTKIVSNLLTVMCGEAAEIRR